MIQLWAQNNWWTGVLGGGIPVPPAPAYWPKLDFTDYRNSMYSCGGF